MENQLDAILYLGPGGGKPSRLNDALCANDAYREMRVSRMALAGRVGAAALLTKECAAAQIRPDFSGKWKPVEAASSASPVPQPQPGGPPPPPRTLSLTIAQSPAEMKVDRLVETGGREALYTFIYKLDGTESVNQMGPLTFRATAMWDGTRLVLSSKVSADEKEIGTSTEVYQLEKEQLIVETTRQTPVGKLTSRTVHTKI